MSLPAAVEVLRENGPLTVREVTSETARRTRCQLDYLAVAASLDRHAAEGLVACTPHPRDFREDVWRALPA